MNKDMRVKHPVLVGMVIIVFAIVGVYIHQTTLESQPTTRQPHQNQNERVLEVKLEVSAPFSTAILLVDRQGTISYEVETSRTGIRKHGSKKITKEQFDGLTDLIIQNNFWSYNEKYFEDGLMDATTYTLSVKSVPTYRPGSADAREYSVSCYGSCPKKIVEIIDKIKELWGKDILETGV